MWAAALRGARAAYAIALSQGTRSGPTRPGVQVFSPQGQHLGTIPTPLPAQAPAFAGRDKKTLYVVGGGAVYSVAMVAQGIQGRAK